MDKLLWLDLNWNLVFFLVAVVVSIIVMKVARVTGLLLLSLVLYLGVDWNMWSWVPPLFWIAWIYSLIFVVVAAFTGGGVQLSKLFAWVAAGIVLCAFVFNSVSAFGDWVNGDGEPPAASISDADDDTTEDPSDDPTDDGDDEVCANTWLMRKSTPKNGDWVNDVPSIRQADTKAEARAAADDWLDKVKGHPQTLKGAAAYILDEDLKVKELVNNKGCATKKAKDLVQEIKTALALATITPDEAPADGYNSFTNPDTGAVFAEGGPIGGDRSAVKIVLRNGKTVWVMARCGNPVTTTRPPIEHEPPDKNPPPKDNPPPPVGCPPGTVPYEGRCVKPAGENDPDGTGGNDSPMSQNPQANPQGGTPGADHNNPPPKDNDPGRTPDGNGQSDHGSPGDGGAGSPTGPSDEDHSDDDTSHTDSPECPLGPGNC